MRRLNKQVLLDSTLYLNAQEKADFVWDCTSESVTL